uniref:Uncharacterized protein n=1 Tax=Rhizophora mucronata TaxID=61149 RepID=A0A2P2QXP8_RHIMU
MFFLYYLVCTGIIHRKFALPCLEFL